MPIALTTGDFNNDGKVDVAVANSGETSITVLFGTGFGAFGTVTNLTPTGSPVAVAAGDFDNDGFEDALTMLYNWQEPGWIANVHIFTEQGQLVRNLIKNQTMGPEGAWVWDGLNDQAERVPVGIYILKIQVFNAGGNVKNYTKTCVVATKLN
jgi:flagellar hook assembly protein FlgD